jgi:hypothetical protein
MQHQDFNIQEMLDRFTEQDLQAGSEMVNYLFGLFEEITLLIGRYISIDLNKMSSSQKFNTQVKIFDVMITHLVKFTLNHGTKTDVTEMRNFFKQKTIKSLDYNFLTLWNLGLDVLLQDLKIAYHGENLLLKIIDKEILKQTN